jgi:hypothetical protein
VVQQMKWLSDGDVQAFLGEHDYDLRKSNNARWIDQKCTADVVTVVADCIMQFTEHRDVAEFSSADIWHNEYTVQNVERTFKKPNPDERKARREYDKFFQQPLEMMAYTGILDKCKRRNLNFYSVTQPELLEYLAIREKNSLNFLTAYITKVLTDSGIYDLFDEFFRRQTRESYDDVKDGFSSFTIANTPINKKLECNRIFTKVINPLSYALNKLGTEGGYISKHKVTYDMLMYNRDNFRDIYANKPKEITRSEYAAQQGFIIENNYTRYLSQKAKRFVRLFNDSFRSAKTEVYDVRHIEDVAVHIHHIFPEATYPEICAYYENLIALTPTQHFNYAHPLGNTHRVDSEYQHICLLAKTGSVRENLGSTEQEHIYAFDKLIYVLFVGLEHDGFWDIENGDYDGVVREINLAYA